MDAAIDIIRAIAWPIATVLIALIVTRGLSKMPDDGYDDNDD